MRGMKAKHWFILLLMFTLSLAGCGKQGGTVTPAGDGLDSLLTPYVTQTLTPTVTSTPENAPTATSAPTQTPTPRLYTVVAKDTLQVIAFRNGLTVAELQAANPDVNPLLLSVGMTLVIPAPSGVSTTPSAQAPTPAALTVESAYCSAITTGGTFCFATVSNAEAFDLANVSALFRLADPLTGDVLTKPAVLPVSRFKKATSVPLFAYFPPPVFANPQVTLQVLSAIQAGETSSLPQVSAPETLVQINADGLSALVSGDVVVAEGSPDAAAVRVSAVAYDEMGAVVGVRRWESTAAVKAGASTQFEIIVYSTAGKIAVVKIFLEANS